MRALCVAGPFTVLQVGVTIHPNHKALLKAHGELSGDQDDTIAAFCHRGKVKDEVIAEVHFNQQDMPLNTVVHEVTHAVLALARYMRLNLEDDQAEELLAESTAAMVDNILTIKRKSAASKRQSK